MADEIFSTLPASLKSRIDGAFDFATNAESTTLHPRKKRRIDKLVDPVESAGGFILEDSEHVEEQTLFTSDSSSPIYISLSNIPVALKRLNLDPNDEETLSIFRNASSGWKNASFTVGDLSSERELSVSRDDWRAVCAVLLEHSAVPHGDLDDGGSGEQELDDVASSDDEYQYEDEPFAGESASDGDDSDEYIDDNGYEKAKPSRASRTQPFKSHLSPHKLTPLQSHECRQAFALFFPGVAFEELDNQRISINDISKAATLLNEKIKAEEVSDIESELYDVCLLASSDTFIRSLRCWMRSLLQWTRRWISRILRG
jgi:hypothetical protein